MLLKLPRLAALVFRSELSALEAVDSVDTIGGTSEGTDLIGGTEDAAVKPNRLPPTAAEMFVEWKTSLELSD